MVWLVAGLQPPHLAAILPFQGFTDHYRDCIRHGGILTAGFLDGWFAGFSCGRSAHRKGRQTRSFLPTNTVFLKDYREYLRDEALCYATHEYYLARTPDPASVRVPMFVWANNNTRLITCTSDFAKVVEVRDRLK